MRAYPRLHVLCVASLSAAFLLAGAAAAEVPGAGVEPGVWQKHEYSFEYMGFTSRYSCDGLAGQLQRLLLSAGARADARAEAGACASGFGRPDHFARATLVFYTLAPPTSGDGDVTAGRWLPVTLGTHHPIELQAGDCELVEQFRDNVLRKMFTIRNVVDNTHCVPHQESGTLIDLRFEVLAEAPGTKAVAVASAPPVRVFAYPKHGQTAAQQSRDRAECEAGAAAESGPDAAAPPGAAKVPAGEAYLRALTACLEARGYSVR
jgi:hypothetical protein